MKNEVDGRREIALTKHGLGYYYCPQTNSLGCHSQSNFHDERILRYGGVPPADRHSH